MNLIEFYAGDSAPFTASQDKFACLEPGEVIIDLNGERKLLTREDITSLVIILVAHLGQAVDVDDEPDDEPYHLENSTYGNDSP